MIKHLIVNADVKEPNNMYFNYGMIILYVIIIIIPVILLLVLLFAK
jgi:hypothetical protein